MNQDKNTRPGGDLPLTWAGMLPALIEGIREESREARRMLEGMASSADELEAAVLAKLQGEGRAR